MRCLRHKGPPGGSQGRTRRGERERRRGLAAAARTAACKTASDHACHRSQERSAWTGQGSSSAAWGQHPHTAGQQGPGWPLRWPLCRQAPSSASVSPLRCALHECCVALNLPAVHRTFRSFVAFTNFENLLSPCTSLLCHHRPGLWPTSHVAVTCHLPLLHSGSAWGPSSQLLSHTV